jgi:hypothetical protein
MFSRPYDLVAAIKLSLIIQNHQSCLSYMCQYDHDIVRSDLYGFFWHVLSVVLLILYVVIHMLPSEFGLFRMFLTVCKINVYSILSGESRCLGKRARSGSSTARCTVF